MDETTYTVSDLLRFTGAKPRTIQFMADNGVLVPLPGTSRQGTGVHRQFSRDEAIVACVAIAFAARKLSIGEVINIAAAVRQHLKKQASREIIEDVIAGKTDALIIIATAAPGAWGATIVEVKNKKSRDTLADVGESLCDLLMNKRQPGVMAPTLWLNACLAKFSE